MANKELTGTCNNCNKVTHVEFKVKHHPNSLQETYIECPECNHHTTCFVTDREVRDMQRKAEHLRIQLRKGKNTVDDLNKLFDRISKRMEKLRRDLINIGSSTN